MMNIATIFPKYNNNVIAVLKEQTLINILSVTVIIGPCIAKIKNTQSVPTFVLIFFSLSYNKYDSDRSPITPTKALIL